MTLRSRLFNYPLRYLLPALFLAVTAATLAYLHREMLIVIRSDVEQEQISHLRLDAATLQTSMEELIREQEIETAQMQISAVIAHPDVLRAFLADERGRLIAAGLRKNIGRTAEEVLAGIFPLAAFREAAARAAATRSGQIVLSEDRLAVAAVYPVFLDLGEENLRPSRTGTLFILHDLGQPLAARRAQAEQWLLEVGAVIAGLALALGLTLHFSVTRRIFRLSGSAEKIAQGDFGAHSGISGNDEIGRLGQTFDAMARQIEQTTAALRESEERHRSLIEQSSDAIILFEPQTRKIVEANPRALELYGYSREEFIGMSLYDIAAESQESVDANMQRVSSEGAHFLGERRARRKDGTVFPIEVNGARVDIGGRQLLMGNIRDIGVRKKAEEQLRLAANVFENSSEAIMITDTRSVIVSVNRAFTAITGYAPEEIVGQTPKILRSGRMSREFYEEVWAALLDSGQWNGEVWNRRKNGEIYPEWLSISCAKNEAGEVTHYIALFSDISDRKAAEERINHLAQHDFLTGLPNRVLLHDRLAQALAHAVRTQKQVAVLFLDLDRFKNVNDSLGHHIGDGLLQKVAQRLASCVRASDTVSRQGGDEFIIMLADIENTSTAAHVAEKLLNALTEPFIVEGNELSITTSIGISIYPDDAQDIQALIKNADTAMYHAKENGRNNYQFFMRGMSETVFERLSLENKLRRAVERNEFLLHYQPQVDIASGRIIGVEALVRWNNPAMGLVSPAKFIPVAEDSGLIVPIGQWVLGEACRQNRAWQDEGLPPVPVAVNLSALQFRQRNFLETVSRALLDNRLEPCYLELELTESIIMHGAEMTIAILQKLKKLGVTLSVDDFGTGYSSLNYLKRFSIDRLKIDQSFVRDICSDPDDAAIATAIIGMAKSLKLKVLAEGVETGEQLDFLRARECDEVQGYYFSRPLPADDLARLLREKPRLVPARVAAGY